MLQVDSVSKIFPRQRGIQKAFARAASEDDVVALRSVGFSVDAGRIVGLVGPNGAGKTTLMRIISTLLDPSTGSVEVNGYESTTAAVDVRRNIGLVLADDRSLYWRLTGRQNLEFFGVMQGLSRSDAVGRSDELLERLGLAHRDKLVFGYSSGMRARLSLGRAMIGRPPLLLLDEPTRALDPIAADDMADLLRQTAEAGVAVLLSSHRLDEVENVCDDVVALVDGGIRFDGTVEELRCNGGFSAALRAMLVVDPAPAEEQS
ncbi:MAG: ABC transporter ATP-binding protein [Ilumatobacter sp.]|uniref:ABC transporter ATP-binding protein n=1 Tax=Ilumatobacter sp. TaxID=1967498 RepID=UPI0032994080